MQSPDGRASPVFSEHGDGLNFYLNPAQIDPAQSEHIRQVLQQAAIALEQQKPSAPMI
jgi:hypothetical protein